MAALIKTLPAPLEAEINGFYDDVETVSEEDLTVKVNLEVAFQSKSRRKGS